MAEFCTDGGKNRGNADHRYMNPAFFVQMVSQVERHNAPEEH